MDLKVAIIGCGAMGTGHAKAWADRTDAKLVSVFDPDTQRCRALAAAHGARACASAEEALGSCGANVASICVPVSEHRPMSELALASGCHVLCEKPIALTDEDARAMIAAARSAGRQLAVSYQYRTFPAYRRCRELVQAGAIGQPVFARFVDVREVRPKLAMHSRALNGGPVIDMAGHYFDLMRFLTGDEARSVYARGHVFGRGKPRLATVKDLAIDAAEILVDYCGGHVLSAFVNWGMPEQHAGMHTNSLVGPSGLLRDFPGSLTLDLADREERFRLGAGPAGPAGRIADLVGAIRGENSLEVDGEVARRALAVSLAAIRSIETGQVVDVTAASRPPQGAK